MENSVVWALSLPIGSASASGYWQARTERLVLVPEPNASLREDPALLVAARYALDSMPSVPGHDVLEIQV